MKQLTSLFLLTLFFGCGPEEYSDPYLPARDGGTDAQIIQIAPCLNLTIDSDHDTISDCHEGSTQTPPRDTDRDGKIDSLDTDSDGDGVLDADEAGDAILATVPVDTDGDGSPDYVDRDSDADGLSDELEDTNHNGRVDACETDRTVADTDSDGVNDLIEVSSCGLRPAAEQSECRCDGTDATQNPRTRGDFVFVVDYEQPPAPEKATMSLSTDINQADVLFALDSTGSMQNCLSDLAKGLSAIVPEIRNKVSNVAFGVIDFRDIGDSHIKPEPDGCPPGMTCCDPGDPLCCLPGSPGCCPHGDPSCDPKFRLSAADMDGGLPPGFPSYALRYDHRIQTVRTTAGLASLQTTLSGLAAFGGGDQPEGGWEGLYAIAGGPRKIIDDYDSLLPLATTFPQPPTAGEEQGSVAGAGFRAGSVPLIVTVTDTEWHDACDSANPSAGDPESGRNRRSGNNGACGVSRRAAVSQLQSIGSHVIGLAAIPFADPAKPTLGCGSQPADPCFPKDRARALAKETGAVVRPEDFGPVGTRPANCAPEQCCTGFAGAGEPPQDGQCPLSFTVNQTSGTGVSGAVTAGIVALSGSLRFDIHVKAQDIDAQTVDRFIDKLVPNLTGTGDATICITLATLEDRFSGPKANPGGDGTMDTFLNTQNGKKICFDVVPKKNTTVQNKESVQVFRAEVQAKGQTGASIYDLGRPRQVWFLVPARIVDTPIQ